MSTDLQQTRLERAQKRAYALWEQAGCPEGQNEEFWVQAERDIGADENDYDKVLADSFPASDPPANSGLTD